MRGLKNYTEKIEGSEKFIPSLRKHSGRLFPIKSDRPLSIVKPTNLNSSLKVAQKT